MKAGDKVRILRMYKSIGIVRRPRLLRTEKPIGIIVGPWVNDKFDGNWFHVMVEGRKNVYPEGRLELINAAG